MKGARRPLGVVNRHPRLRIERRSLAAAIALIDAHAGSFRGGCPAGELSLAFMTDEALAALHGKFLSDPSPTDVITFDGDAAVGTAGEICISVDAAVRHAGRSRAKLSAELTLYAVHGWLHLAGYDDRTPPDKREMRLAEGRALRLLARFAAVPRFKLA